MGHWDGSRVKIKVVSKGCPVSKDQVPLSMLKVSFKIDKEYLLKG